MRRFFLSFALVSLAFGLSTASATAAELERGIPSSPVPAELSPRVGDTAPAFVLRAYNEDVALKLVRSGQVSLNNFVGLGAEYPRKVVLIGFSSLSNERSRKDYPIFQRLYKKFRDEDVMIIMISVDSKDTQALYDLLEKEKITFPVLRDRFGVAYRRYGIQKLPSLFLLDKDGQVVSIGEGYTDNIESYLEGEIKRLLAE